MTGLLFVLGVVALIVVLSAIGNLKSRVWQLERQLAQLQEQSRHAAPSPRPPASVQPAQAASAPDRPVEAVPAASASASVPEPTLAELMRRERDGQAPPVLAPVAAPAAASIRAARGDTAPDAFTLAVRAVRRWFSMGNVPVKIGMVVLFAGVAALLKYAADQGWMSLPPALKLAGIAAVALAALAFAWRKREMHRVFALSLQGGAIGVLLLVVFAAFKVFGLLSAGAAFGLSVLLVAAMALLAVVQDAKALAVLATLAGFLAPIWLSTGSGNHVVLFAYYALLDAGIFAIAWRKSWRVLNLLGFAFTFGIGTLWGVLSYRPENHASVQPFLALFFAMFLALPLLFARRQPPSRRDAIDACLVFGTPLFAFCLQAGLMRDDAMSLAWCALGVAAVYALLALWLRGREGYGMLRHAYAVLATGFATLAVPLALSAQSTACVFALEGAALAWLGLRQRRALPQLSGAALQLAAGVAYSLANFPAHSGFVFNARCMTALLIAVAGFASAGCHRARREDARALAYYAWALLWWCGNGVHEISWAQPHADVAFWLLGFAAISAWLAAEAHARRPAGALVLTAAAMLAVGFWQAVVQRAHPFDGNAAWAWLLYAVLGLRSLWNVRGSGHRFDAAVPFAWWLVWAWALGLWLRWLGTQHHWAEGWRLLLPMLPALALAALAIKRDSLYFGRALASVLMLASGLWWLSGLSSAGDSAPLPWIPLLNPLEAGQFAVLWLALRWRKADGEFLLPRWLVACVALVGISSVVVHAVHQWGGLAWDGALVSSSLAQTSLSITWSVLGVLAWIVGSRQGRRALWRLGAVLMAVVLVKLVLVDRQHLGNLLGIGSFIGYGLLCTVVGYLAPAPPREDEAGAAA